MSDDYMGDYVRSVEAKLVRRIERLEAKLEAAEKERDELRARIAELESAIDQFAGRTREDCPIPELRFALEGPALLTEGKVG